MPNAFLQKVVEESTSKAAALRWRIHENPELANQEFETTEQLAQFFKTEGMTFHRFDSLTGGYVRIAGQAASAKTLCFRADIDALPITEGTGCAHRSKRAGVMHACGHDMHTAIAAGLALTLHRMQEQLANTILILFQPAEENNPIGGASPVIQTGLFTQMGVQGIFGLHLWPSLAVGRIGVKPGVLMGASDKFSVDIYGQSAHAAEPHKGVDAISIGADLVNALVHKLRREIDPFSTCLVTVGALRSFGRYNILCDHVQLEGTIRTITAQAREKVKQRICELSTSIAHSYGGRAEVTIADGYGFVTNHQKQTADFIQIAQSLLGEAQVHTDVPTSLIGEDFSCYAEVLPATYFFLGCESDAPLHNNCFLPNERVLPLAISLMVDFFMADC